SARDGAGADSFVPAGLAPSVFRRRGGGAVRTGFGADRISSASVSSTHPPSTAATSSGGGISVGGGAVFGRASGIAAVARSTSLRNAKVAVFHAPMRLSATGRIGRGGG